MDDDNPLKIKGTMQKYIKVNSKPIIANSSVDKVPSSQIKPPNCMNGVLFASPPNFTGDTLHVLKGLKCTLMKQRVFIQRL